MAFIQYMFVLFTITFLGLIAGINNQSSGSTSYSYDGTGNNLDHPEWGSANIPLLRLFGYHYSDGVSGFLYNRPTCCQLGPSFKAAHELTNSFGLNQAGVIFAQLSISHDIAFTKADPLDRVFSEQCIPGGVQRLQSIPGSSPRDHPNILTSYFDMSNVYGENEDKALRLRSLRDGLMKTSEGNMLPRGCTFHGVFIETADEDPETLFCAGDPRVNENPYLTAYHTIFVREHNRLAASIKHNHRNWTDEQIFQKARQLNIAGYQNMVFYELLPILLGERFFDQYLKNYPGYDPELNAGIFAELTHSVIRATRSHVANSFIRIDEHGNEASHTLSDLFFHPQMLISYPFEDWMRGMNEKPAQPFGPSFAPSLITTPMGQLDLHLDVLDCFRSRELGMLDYRSVRKELGIPFETYQDVANGTRRLSILNQYLDRDSIDLFIGMISETPLPGSPVGPMFQQLMALQYDNLRRGDRFWFENPGYLTAEELATARDTTMDKIIRRNTDLRCVRQQFFKLPHFSPLVC